MGTANVLDERRRPRPTANEGFGVERRSSAPRKRVC